jgi:hypothetical protein
MQTLGTPTNKMEMVVFCFVRSVIALVIAKDDRVLKLAELLEDKAKSPSSEFVDRAKDILTAGNARPWLITDFRNKLFVILTWWYASLAVMPYACVLFMCYCHIDIARAEGKLTSNVNGDDAKRPGTARKRPGLTVGTDKSSLTPSQTPTSTPPPVADGAPSTSGTGAGQPAVAAAGAIIPVPEPGSAGQTRLTRAGSGLGEEGKSARLLHRPQEISLKAVEVASSTDEAAEEDANLRKRASRAAKRASLPAQLPTHVKDKVRVGTIEEGKEDLATPAPAGH